MLVFKQRLEKEIKKLEREAKYGKASDKELRQLAAFKEMLIACEVGLEEVPSPQ